MVSYAAYYRTTLRPKGIPKLIRFRLAGTFCCLFVACCKAETIQPVKFCYTLLQNNLLSSLLMTDFGTNRKLLDWWQLISCISTDDGSSLLFITVTDFFMEEILGYFQKNLAWLSKGTTERIVRKRKNNTRIWKTNRQVLEQILKWNKRDLWTKLRIDALAGKWIIRRDENLPIHTLYTESMPSNAIPEIFHAETQIEIAYFYKLIGNWVQKVWRCKTHFEGKTKWVSFGRMVRFLRINTSQCKL